MAFKLGMGVNTAKRVPRIICARPVWAAYQAIPRFFSGKALWRTAIVWLGKWARTLLSNCGVKLISGTRMSTWAFFSTKILASQFKKTAVLPLPVLPCNSVTLKPFAEFVCFLLFSFFKAAACSGFRASDKIGVFRDLLLLPFSICWSCKGWLIAASSASALCCLSQFLGFFQYWGMLGKRVSPRPWM